MVQRLSYRMDAIHPFEKNKLFDRALNSHEMLHKRIYALWKQWYSSVPQE